MFDQATVASIVAIADARGWPASALLAIAEVESGGKAFEIVNGRAEPLIRWEGHYFDKRLSGAQRAKARSAGLAASKAGAVPNPVRQAGRWTLLARAVEIDATAAYESASYGVGQVMGAHWDWLGFGSVTELVNLCRRDVSGQVEVMARFIDKAGLAGALRRGDWAGFAKGYNGPAFKNNAYDTKMAVAARRWARQLSATPAAPKPAAFPTLKRGDRGDAVLALQRRLAARGRDLVGDGDFGPATEAAVRAFQEQAGLDPDGIVGPRTWAALQA